MRKILKANTFQGVLFLRLCHARVSVILSWVIDIFSSTFLKLTIKKKVAMPPKMIAVYKKP